ncbi:MAG: CHASE4 domain-containing protein [Synechococcus sp.]
MQDLLPNLLQQSDGEVKHLAPETKRTITIRLNSSLRFKVISLVGLAFAVMFFGQFAVARVLLLGRYTQLEADLARRNAERMRNALSTELNRIRLLSNDYSAWDDTYDFVETEDPEYIDSNFVDTTFSDSELNAILIADSTGQLVFEKGFNLEDEEETAVPSELLALASGSNAFFSHPDVESSIVGIVTISDRPMLVASEPIVTSNDEGPVRGSLTMGRFLDDALIEQLGEVTELPVTMIPYDGQQALLTDQSVWGSMIAKDEPTTYKVLDENTIASYALVRDLQNQPLLILSARMPRDIYARGRESLTYYFWTTLAMGIGFCSLTLLLLDRLVLCRLSRLSRDVTNIGSTGNIATRLELPGQDELSHLAETINWTLSCLETAQQALIKSEERYALSVKGANDGVWDWNLQTGELYLSPRWKSIVGYADEELGNNQAEWFQRVHPDDLDTLKSDIDRHRDGETAKLSNDHRLLHKDGSYRWVMCRGVASGERFGNACRMAGSLTDITERKLAAQTLASQAQELARSNQELEQFAYVASHDLQEPLRKIQAFGDRLNSKFGKALDERGRDYLERMQGAAQRMQTLIQDLLTFSRVTSQAQPLESVNLTEIVEGVLSDLEIRIHQTEAKVEFGTLPELEADPLQMRQLFQNLIGNALKFARPGISPIVTIRSERCQIHIGQAEETSDVYRISIADNGIGFDEKYGDRIFKVFQRLHGRSEYEGTGIGLAVCEKIVERHGGNIEARSQPGQGATFTITLPAC